MTDNADNQADSTLDQTNTTSDGTTSAVDDRTFTQADIDRVVKHRVGEALNRQKAQFAGFDELKQKADQFDQLQEANKTELEKASAHIKKLEKEAAEASLRAKDSLIRASVIGEAAKRNVVDPDAALALIDKASLDIGEDGTPSNIADAMDALLKAKPYLVGGGRNGADLGARSGSAGGGQLTREDLQKMTDAQIVEADNAGRLETLKRGA